MLFISRKLKIMDININKNEAEFVRSNIFELLSLEVNKHEIFNEGKYFIYECFNSFLSDFRMEISLYEKIADTCTYYALISYLKNRLDINMSQNLIYDNNLDKKKLNL